MNEKLEKLNQEIIHGIIKVINGLDRARLWITRRLISITDTLIL